MRLDLPFGARATVDCDSYAQGPIVEKNRSGPSSHRRLMRFKAEISAYSWRGIDWRKKTTKNKKDRRVSKAVTVDVWRLALKKGGSFYFILLWLRLDETRKKKRNENEYV